MFIYMQLKLKQVISHLLKGVFKFLEEFQLKNSVIFITVSGVLSIKQEHRQVVYKEHDIVKRQSAPPDNETTVNVKKTNSYFFWHFCCLSTQIIMLLAFVSLRLQHIL